MNFGPPPSGKFWTAAFSIFMPELPLPKSNVEWHAAITHFPITLLFVAVFFDLVALFYRRPGLREFSLWMLTLCVISLPFSLLSGWLTGREYKRAPVGYDQHWQAAVITSVLALVLLVWRLAAKDKLPRTARIMALTLTGACAMGVGYTGHQGGLMVFGGRTAETAVAEVPAPDVGAERIALSADKMQVAADKLGVSTDRLAQAAASKVAPPPPIVIEKQPINVVPADALNTAAQKLEGAAARFEQTAKKMEQIAETLKNTKTAAPAPVATSVQPSGTKPNGKTPTPAPAATQPAKSDLDPKLVALGEKLYFSEDLACDSCHKIDGKGGKKGPDLTYAGRLHGDIEWQIGHLKDPAKYVPGSKMPDYADQSPENLRALAVFMVSKK